MISSNPVVQRSNSRVNSRFPGSSKTTKHIFVTGGVASSLGKGLTASSLGHLLRARGLSVTMQKLDPYLNVDPGTMNPFQHGEVFVTDDGAETDLDIGHYERFLDENLEGSANVTTGQVYSTVIAKERRGEYLGDTVQVIPHITDEIKRRMRLPAEGKNAPDVIITEIGGTVGDIESQPFLESARQVRQDVGRNNVFFLHVSLVPYIGPSQELKTKPTQHSVAALRSIGIQPEAIVIRSDRDVPQAMREKIGRMCDVDIDAVIGCPDAPSIYDIPKTLHSQGLDSYIVRALDLPFKDVDWTSWDKLLEAVHNPKHEVEIALVGKYIDLPDAYLSVTEAVKAGGFAHETHVNITWIPSDLCETPDGAAKALGGLDVAVGRLERHQEVALALLLQLAQLRGAPAVDPLAHGLHVGFDLLEATALRLEHVEPGLLHVEQEQAQALEGLGVARVLQVGDRVVDLEQAEGDVGVAVLEDRAEVHVPVAHAHQVVVQGEAVAELLELDVRGSGRCRRSGQGQGEQQGGECFHCESGVGGAVVGTPRQPSRQRRSVLRRVPVSEVSPR